MNIVQRLMFGVKTPFNAIRLVLCHKELFIFHLYGLVALAALLVCWWPMLPSMHDLWSRVMQCTVCSLLTDMFTTRPLLTSCGAFAFFAIAFWVNVGFYHGALAVLRGQVANIGAATRRATSCLTPMIVYALLITLALWAVATQVANPMVHRIVFLALVLPMFTYMPLLLASRDMGLVDMIVQGWMLFWTTLFEVVGTLFVFAVFTWVCWFACHQLMAMGLMTGVFSMVWTVVCLAITVWLVTALWMCFATFFRAAA